nr:hypothetical protein [Tanacetum cinerariifolium]
MSTISRIIRRFSTTTVTTKPPSISEDLNKEKNLKRVVEKFKKLSESHLFRKQSNVYTNTVRRLASAKKLKYIEEILEDQKQYDDISKEGFNVRLISLYGKSGMFDHAFKVFDEMSDKKSVKAFNAVLGACAFVEMGKFDLACEVFGEIEKNGLDADLISFNTLLIGLYGNGRFVDGERFWGKMIGSSVAPDIRSYNARLVGLVAERKVNEAVEVFGELGSKNI